MRDVTLARMGAELVGDHGRVSEIRRLGCEGLDLLDLDQIGVVGHAIDHVNRVRRSAILHLVEHGQEGREPGAAGEKQEPAV